ncbi:hypothetical protein K0G88_21440 [Bacteroides ovatus]|nr:hypothetical protein [Phocaeicola vulgatus]MCE9166612.1 hypothetical protein [Bacteroides ovatus]
MEKATFKYPANRLGGHLPNRISAPSDTRSYNDAVIHGFNDFMTRCRHSSAIRIPASPQNRIRDDPPVCLFTETDNAATESAYKQKNKS